MSYRTKLSPYQVRIIAVLSGLAIIGFAGYSAYRSTAAQSWAQTSGTISESRAVRHRSSYSGHRRRRRSRYKSRPVLKYEYHVGGKKYENDRITFTTLNLFNFRLGELKTGFYTTLEKYPKGKSIVVYYDPEQPDDAVVEPKLTLSFYALVLLGGGLTAFGALGVIPDAPVQTSKSMNASMC